jgi:RNA polymerase sigma-70 factor (ECF subfamily)
MGMPLDADLIAEIRSGNRDAFATLVREHQEWVLSLCISLLRSKAEAEDAAQDIFVKAYKHLASFRAESSFSTWLYRIAYRHCLDLLRSRKRHHEESWDALLERQGEIAHPSQREEAASSIADQETRVALQKALDSLLPDYRLVLTLREVQELSYEEIAGVTNTSLDSVKARLKRARAALQEKARHFWPTPLVQPLGETQ